MKSYLQATTEYWLLPLRLAARHLARKQGVVVVIKRRALYAQRHGSGLVELAEAKLRAPPGRLGFILS